MSKKKTANPFPQLNLKLPDFIHEVPEDHSFELVIEYKKGGMAREFIAPVHTFAIDGPYLRVTNRISPLRFSFEIKKIKSAYLVPTGEM